MSVSLSVTPKVSKNLPMKILSFAKLKSAEARYKSSSSEINQMKLAVAVDTFKKYSK